jgi:hypothetical protein
MANQWFKFYGGEYLSDPKMLQLNASERSCWVTLLCLASQSENGEIKFFSEAQLFALSGVYDHPTGIMQKFEDLQMLRFCNGIVTLLNWEKRQYSEGYSRVRKFRKRVCNAKDNDRREENRIDKKELPEFLDKKVWEQWIAYRKEIKKALKPSTTKLQLTFLEKNKVDHSAIILQSIQNGWTGLFPLKSNFNSKSPPIPSNISDAARAHAKRIQEDEDRREREENAMHNEGLRKVEEVKKSLMKGMQI